MNPRRIDGAKHTRQGVPRGGYVVRDGDTLALSDDDQHYYAERHEFHGSPYLPGQVPPGGVAHVSERDTLGANNPGDCWCGVSHGRRPHLDATGEHGYPTPPEHHTRPISLTAPVAVGDYLRVWCYGTGEPTSTAYVVVRVRRTEDPAVRRCLVETTAEVPDGATVRDIAQTPLRARGLSLSQAVRRRTA